MSKRKIPRRRRREEKSNDHFSRISLRARTLRTQDAVLDLLNLYAGRRCGTLTQDTQVINEVFPNGAPGFLLIQRGAWAGVGSGYTVIKQRDRGVAG